MYRDFIGIVWIDRIVVFLRTALFLVMVLSCGTTDERNVIFSFRSFFLSSPLSLSLFLSQQELSFYKHFSSDEDDTPFSTIRELVNYIADLN